MIKTIQKILLENLSNLFIFWINHANIFVSQPLSRVKSLSCCFLVCETLQMLVNGEFDWFKYRKPSCD